MWVCMERDYDYVSVEDDEHVINVVEKMVQNVTLTKVKVKLAEAEEIHAKLSPGPAKDAALNRVALLERKEELLLQNCPQRLDVNFNKMFQLFSNSTEIPLDERTPVSHLLERGIGTTVEQPLYIARKSELSR